MILYSLKQVQIRVTLAAFQGHKLAMSTKWLTLGDSQIRDQSALDSTYKACYELSETELEM